MYNYMYIYICVCESPFARIPSFFIISESVQGFRGPVQGFPNKRRNPCTSLRNPCTNVEIVDNA